MKHALWTLLLLLWMSTNAVAQNAPVIGKKISPSISGSLADRRLRSLPRLTAPLDSIPVGTVKFAICVDSTGSVAKAEYQPESSTIIDDGLKKRMLEYVLKYTFAPTSVGLQCGQIIIKILDIQQ